MRVDVYRENQNKNQKHLFFIFIPEKLWNEMNLYYRPKHYAIFLLVIWLSGNARVHDD